MCAKGALDVNNIHMQKKQTSETLIPSKFKHLGWEMRWCKTSSVFSGDKRCDEQQSVEIVTHTLCSFRTGCVHPYAVVQKASTSRQHCSPCTRTLSIVKS